MNNTTLYSGIAKAGLVTFCVGGLVLAWQDFNDQAQVRAVDAGATPLIDRLSDAEVSSPDILKSLARHSILHGEDPIDVAISKLRRSLEINPDQPDAHALLAYALALDAGRATEAVNIDLRESFRQCLFCDEELTKWRLEFVLAYWPGIDEGNRLSAFEGADFLRWWHLQYDYLAELRERSEARGIPFAEYQRKISTPVRPNEVPPPAP